MTVVVVELVLAAAVALAFIPVFGDPRRKLDRGMAWHVVAVTASVGALAVLLLLSVLGAAIPLWLGQVVLACLDAALIWRLALAIKARRRP